jgi:hypothetical protein
MLSHLPASGNEAKLIAVTFSRLQVGLTLLQSTPEVIPMFVQMIEGGWELAPLSSNHSDAMPINLS